MAEDHHYQTSGNWWDSAKNVRFESGSSQSSSSGVTNNMGNFGWQTAEMADMKPRCSMDSISPNSGSSSVIFHDANKKLPDSSTSSEPNLHMMGLGLSSHAMDWNQASLLRGEKAEENNFRSILQENLSSSSTDFQQETAMTLTQVQWREKLFSTENSSTNEFKQVNRGFSLDQTQFSPQYSSNDRLDSSGTSQGFPPGFQVDSSGALYGNPSLLQGLISSDNQAQQVAMNFPYQASDLMPSNWSKVPQFLRASPPKQLTHNQLQFTNNTPFWNASEAAIKDVRSSFFPSLQPPLSPPNLGGQTKNISQVRDTVSVAKKSGSEGAPKRPRNETSSSLPAFKVRKEKMGDRITALQQLVSPFGKTDTASVLSEAIEYIKFLHEQVTVLSTPYMKSGAPVQHQQSSGKSKEAEVPKQDLRSRGLCLVPVSSTYPVAHESAVDFWTPTFGGTTFR